MKKIITCLLALCMVASITAVGWNGLNLGASAEGAETTGRFGGSDIRTAGTSGADIRAVCGERGYRRIHRQRQRRGFAGQYRCCVSGRPDRRPETADATVSEPPTDVQDALVPEETVDPDATLDPDATEGAEVTAEVTNAPMPEADVGSGPAWIAEGAHRRYGELDELLPIVIVETGSALCARPASLR